MTEEQEAYRSTFLANFGGSKCTCRLCEQDRYDKELKYMDSQKKKCQCKWCTEDSPRYEEVTARLTGDDLAYVESLFEKLMHVEDDLNYVSSQLDGSWPGWEWIIEEKKKRGLK